MKILRRFAIAALVATAGVGSVGVAGLRINTTHSIQPGIYWLTDRQVTTGATVLMCPPQIPLIAEAHHRGYFGAGFCPGGYEQMFKKILAAKNDVVSIDAAGVSVNGSRLPNTAQVSTDPAGRPLPDYRVENLRLSGDDVLLIADNSPLSFDARYYGPVDRSHIRGVVVPLLIW